MVVGHAFSHFLRNLDYSIKIIIIQSAVPVYRPGTGTGSRVEKHLQPEKPEKLNPKSPKSLNLLQYLTEHVNDYTCAWRL